MRRRPWRTALVLLLVALPVGALTGTAIVYRTIHQSPAEQWAAHGGRSDDVAETFSSTTRDAFTAGVRDAYPEGSRIVFAETAPEAVTGAGGHLLAVQHSNEPVDDPLLDGMLELTDGRAPREAGEAAVTPAVLEATGARLGDRIDLLRADDVRVTGVVTLARDHEWMQVFTTTPPVPHAALVRSAFVDLPPGGDPPDLAVLERFSAYNLGGSEEWFDSRTLRQELGVLYVATGVVLAVVALAASAFAIGARRQLRTLGLLAASGASPAALRRTVLLQGTTAGVLGSATGVVLAVAAVTAAHPFFDDVANRTIGPLEVHPLDLLVAALLGVVAATAAAWFPARSAARVPVLSALGGRRPLPRLPRAVPLAGAAVAATGIVVLGVVARDPVPSWGAGLVASLATLFGAVALAPWLVSHTGPLAERLRGGARLAARDLARQRVRSGAVVAAVMAPAGLAVVAALSAATNDARDEVRGESGTWLDAHEVVVDFYGAPRETADDELRAVARVLPDAERVEYGTPMTRDGGGFSTAGVATVEPGAGGSHEWPEEAAGLYTEVTVVDPDDLAAAGLAPALVDALRAGKVVLPPGWPTDHLRLVGGDSEDDADGGTAEVTIDPADVFPSDVPLHGNVRGAAMSPERAARWGLDVRPVAVLFRNPEPLTADQRAAVEEIADEQCAHITDPGCRDEALRAYLETGASDSTNVSTGPLPTTEDVDASLLLHVATVGGSLVFTLAVVAVALALSAAEGRGERALLSAIGAGPETRRSMVAWQAFLLAAMAVALAVPIGLAAGWSIESEPDSSGVGPQIPWSVVGLLVVVLPLGTAAVAWLGAALSGRRTGDLSTVALATD